MQAESDNEKIMNSLIVEAILTKSQMKQLDVELIENAYRFASEAVGERLRESDGTSFIGHFIRVPAVLALELDVSDSEIISSGFLHALVAHTKVTLENLEHNFGKRIADLVGLWTLRSEDDQKHRDLIRRLEESPEKLAALVKLSDRLDNTRRLRFADRPGKREQYMRQTEDLYLPLAKRTNEYIYEAFLRAIGKLKS